ARWISRDLPVNRGGGTNPYQYVSDNPVAASDPSGLLACLWPGPEPDPIDISKTPPKCPPGETAVFVTCYHAKDKGRAGECAQYCSREYCNKHGQPGGGGRALCDHSRSHHVGFN